MLTFAQRVGFILVALAMLLTGPGCDPGPIIWRVKRSDQSPPPRLEPRRTMARAISFGRLIAGFAVSTLLFVPLVLWRIGVESLPPAAPARPPPPIAQIQSMSELATTRVHLSDFLEGKTPTISGIDPARGSRPGSRSLQGALHQRGWGEPAGDPPASPTPSDRLQGRSRAVRGDFDQVESVASHEP